MILGRRELSHSRQTCQSTGHDNVTINWNWGRGKSREQKEREREREREREVREKWEQSESKVRAKWEKWEMEVGGAPHNNHYGLISYVWVWFMGMGWFHTLYEWLLYIYSPGCTVLCGPARRLASSSCFSWMKRLHGHTQLVRIELWLIRSSWPWWLLLQSRLSVQLSLL